MIVRNRYAEVLDYSIDESERKDVLIIFGHGVTGHKDRPLYVNVSKKLSEFGWECLRFSFAGNGDSEGNFEEATIPKEVEDLHSLLDQIKGNKKIVYVGHSMGGAVGALAAAKDDRIDALVSLAGMVRTKAFCEAEFGEETPDQGCMWDDESCPLSSQFVESMHQIDNTLNAVREIRTPWLLVHGSEDDVVLLQDSEDLYLTLRGKKKKVILEGANHVFEDDHDRVADEIHAWLSEIGI